MARLIAAGPDRALLHGVDRLLVDRRPAPGESTDVQTLRRGRPDRDAHPDPDRNGPRRRGRAAMGLGL